MKDLSDSMWKQFCAVICVNIMSISHGSFIAWPSASFLTLQSEQSPLEKGPMTNSEAGWVASMYSVGGLIGNFFFAWLSDLVGRKLSLQLIVLPDLIAWLTIPFATTPTHLMISRFFGGFSGGGVLTLVPIYVSEISDNRIRGKFGSFQMLSCNFGILLGFILGSLLAYDDVAYIFATLNVIFLALFSFMPETSHYLTKKINKKEAHSARARARLQNAPIELKEIREDEIESLTNTKSVSWRDFNNRTTRKAILIGSGITILNQLSGCFTMISYTGTIFKQSGSNISPNNSAIVVGSIKVVASFLPLILVERVGRKFLITASALGTGIGHLSLGTYIYLSSLGYDLDALNWIPVFSFSFTIFAGSCGLLTLTFLVVSEIMPPQVRSVGCMISMSFIWSFSFILLRFLPQVADVFGMHVVVLTFCGCCFLGAIFILTFVPETRGKSFEEIMKLI